MAMSTRSMSPKTQVKQEIVSNSCLSNSNNESRQMNSITNKSHTKTSELPNQRSSSQANTISLDNNGRTESSGYLFSQYNLDSAALVRLLSQPMKDKLMDTRYIDQNMTDSTMYFPSNQQTMVGKLRSLNSLANSFGGESGQTVGSTVSTATNSPFLHKRSLKKELPHLTIRDPSLDLSVVEPFLDMNLDSPASTTSTFSPDTFLSDSSNFLTSESLFSTNHILSLRSDSLHFEAATINNDSDDDDDLHSYFPVSASAVSQKRRKAKKHAVCVPRPKNCFMLYRSKVLPMIMAELGAINNKIISKIAAERWRAEPEAVKSWYRTKARQGKEEHAKNNPGYRYAPHKRLSSAATASPNSRSLTRREERRPRNERDHDSLKPLKAFREDPSHLLDADESRVIDNDTSGDFIPTAKKRSWRKLPHQNKPKSCKSTRWDDDDMFPFTGLLKEDSGISSNKRHCSKGTMQEVQKKHQTDNTHFHQDQHQQPTALSNSNISVKSVDSGMRTKFGSTPGPTSAESYSSVGQQLLLAMQQNSYQSLLQQQQQFQLTSLLQGQGKIQAQPTLPLPLPSGQISSAATTTLYNLPAGGNSSSCTLVDPVNDWMTHNYHSDSLFGGLTSQVSAINGFNSKQAATMSNEFIDITAGSKLADKELPPLPQDQLAGLTDPSFLLSQLYTQYNSNRFWDQPLSFQDFPIQLYDTKEPEPVHGISNISLGGQTSIAQWSFIPDVLSGGQSFIDHQSMQQKVGQEDQASLQPQYLIKPASSAEYMSFTDIGYGSKSVMDMLFLPDQQ